MLVPYSLGFYFEKEDVSRSYHWLLLRGLLKGANFCKELGVGMCVKKRVDGGEPSDILKQQIKIGLLWHMFFRLLDKGEFNGSHNIDIAWGLKVAGTINKFFFKAHQDKSTSNFIVLRSMCQMGWRSQLQKSVI